MGSSGHRKGPRVLASRPHLTGLPPSHQVPSGALAPMENTAGNLTQAARCLYSTLGAAGLSRGGAGGGVLLSSCTRQGLGQPTEEGASQLSLARTTGPDLSSQQIPTGLCESLQVLAAMKSLY